MIGAGIFALNQYAERSTDAMMKRTESRPLPSGKLTPARALAFGVAFSVAAVAVAAVTINMLTALISVLVLVSYVGIYTPLKRVTSLHTIIGAVPGAAPPLIGWAAATGSLSIEAWILFAILFFWQFPHFLSIEMIYDQDYARAGIKVLPNARHGRILVGIQLIVSGLLLIAATVLPYVVGMDDRPVYLALAVALGLVFLATAVRSLYTMRKLHARHLLRASVIYLPVIFVLLFALR